MTGAAVSGPEGSSMGWVLRLAETGPDAAGESIDLIEIHRSSGLADIANLGLTLSAAKQLLARVQQALVAAQGHCQVNFCHAAGRHERIYCVDHATFRVHVSCRQTLKVSVRNSR